MTKNQEYRSKLDQQTDKMAPKQTRVVAKDKELQTTKIPLMRRLKFIKNTKVQESSWEKLWAEIKEWAYVDKIPTQVAEKINHITIVNYINAPLIMASFGSTKETMVKFIISRYHNGKFYFDRSFKISGEVIYKLIGLSNQGDPVPLGIKEGLVEELTGSASGKKLQRAND